MENETYLTHHNGDEYSSPFPIQMDSGEKNKHCDKFPHGSLHLCQRRLKDGQLRKIVPGENKTVEAADIIPSTFVVKTLFCTPANTKKCSKCPNVFLSHWPFAGDMCIRCFERLHISGHEGFYRDDYRELIRKELLEEIIHQLKRDRDEKEVMIRAFDQVSKMFEGRTWLTQGRGAYKYDDDRYKLEVKYLMDEFNTLKFDTWKNIQTKTFEYKQAIIKEHESNVEKLNTELLEALRNMTMYFRPDIDGKYENEQEKHLKIGQDLVRQYYKHPPVNVQS